MAKKGGKCIRQLRGKVDYNKKHEKIQLYTISTHYKSGVVTLKPKQVQQI